MYMGLEVNAVELDRLGLKQRRVASSAFWIIAKSGCRDAVDSITARAGDVQRMAHAGSLIVKAV